jgi:hypothetical protein
MPSIQALLLAACGLLVQQPEATAEPFDSPRFGLKVALPGSWKLAVREEEDKVFVALIPQADPEKPGVVLCELALAPESLDEYRTRIEGGPGRGGKLARNEVVDSPKGKRLITVREFRPREGGLWRELSVRVVAHRQMYTFLLNVDDATYPTAKVAFEAMVDTAEFKAPDTGADLASKPENRWLQREFRFTLDLPEGWSPALAPSSLALFYANAAAHGIWADNVLVLAAEPKDRNLEALAKDLPDQLRAAEPECEVLSCKVIDQPSGKGPLKALETVVRTKRGPFSMTVLERRFRGERYNYEVKFTIESSRFDALAPALRKSLDSFGEAPGDAPVAGKRRAA